MIYLLENNDGKWFKGFSYDKTKVNIIMESELTTDANKAWQFSNKNDAEYYIKWQTSPVFTSQEFVVTEYELKSAETPIIETELEIIEKQIRIASELHNDMKTITEYGHDGKKHEFVLLSEYEELEIIIEKQRMLLLKCESFSEMITKEEADLLGMLKH